MCNIPMCQEGQYEMIVLSQFSSSELCFVLEFPARAQTLPVGWDEEAVIQ